MKPKHATSSRSLPKNQTKDTSQSAHSLPKQHTQIESQIYQFNFKVLAREPSLRNIQKILCTLSYVALAHYQIEGDYWNYLKVKGPCFLVVDKYSQKKIVILNQCSTQNYFVNIEKDSKLQLKRVNDGYLFNYCIEDSIIGISIYGLWTTDKNVEVFYKIIKGVDLPKYKEKQ